MHNMLCNWLTRSIPYPKMQGGARVRSLTVAAAIEEA